MKTIAAFIAINALLFAANAVGAAVVALVGQIAAALGAANEPWAWLLVGYVAAAAGVAFAIILVWLATLRPVIRGTK